MEPASRPVLIVDCELDMAEAVAQSAERLDQEVLVAYDGESAVATALQAYPFLVIFELSLPDVDGAELARRLRSYPELDSTALVSVSNGPPAPATISAMKKAGCLRHFVKPVSDADLEDLIPLARKFRVGRSSLRT